MKIRHGVCLLAAALAAPAFGQLGNVMFSLETPTDTIGIWNASTGVRTDLLNFADPDVRLAGLMYGPDGNFYVADGPFPISQDPVGRILRIQNIFTGAPTVTAVSQGGIISNPIGIAYHPGSNSILAVNNPGGDQFPNNRFEGVLAAPFGGGAATPVFTEGPFPPVPRPQYHAGAYLVEDPQGTGDFFVTSIEGGNGPVEGSQIYRLSVDNAGVGTMTRLVDLNNIAESGFGSAIEYATGITAIPGTNQLFFTDRRGGTIYELLLNPDGSYNSINPLLAGLNDPEVITYDPFDDKLVFDGNGGINRINVDGTGYEQIVAGVHARGLVVVPFVPAPATGAALGLLGLVAIRRRR